MLGPAGARDSGCQHLLVFAAGAEGDGHRRLGPVAPEPAVVAGEGRGQRAVKAGDGAALLVTDFLPAAVAMG